MLPRAVFSPVGQVSGPVRHQGKNLGQDVYLFDLDALVPSTYGQLDAGFADYLREFADAHPCYLVASATYNNIMARLPGRVRRAFAGIFAASGAEFWINDEMISRTQHDFSDDLYEFVVKVVQKSAYPAKNAPVLECGPASLRVCLAGTKSTAGQLEKYRAWEAENRELPAIMDEFRVRFRDHNIHMETNTSLLVLPSHVSAASVRGHLLERHAGGRIIAYLSPMAAEGYAQPLRGALSGTDVCSVVQGSGDVSQLLSYEKRRSSGEELLVSLPWHQLVEA